MAKFSRRKFIGSSSALAAAGLGLTIHTALAADNPVLEESVAPDYIIPARKLADFVILADDPHDVEPDRIKEIEIVPTVVGGQTMYGV